MLINPVLYFKIKFYIDYMETVNAVMHQRNIATVDGNGAISNTAADILRFQNII